MCEISPAYIKRALARLIAQATIARGAVDVRDVERAGISEADARRHMGEALMMARHLEPAIDAAVEIAA